MIKKYAGGYCLLLLILSLCVVTLYGCFRQIFGRFPTSSQVKRYSSESMWLINDDFSSFLTGDDLSRDSLHRAISQSLKYLEIVPDDQIFYYGNIPYSTREVAASMRLFQDMLNRNLSYRELIKELEENFYAFASSANADDGVLFTGYYEPIFEGSLTRTSECRIPVYSLPPDLQVLELGDFRESLRDRTIVYRMEKNAILPYFTRQEIMENKALAGRNSEIAWMKDPIDLFFIQVQGSGILLLSSGKKVKLSYAGSNGHKYSSIGKFLVEEGVMELEQVSLDSIREYLDAHPKDLNRILYHNKSYTFFSLREDGGAPRGNINVPLTPHRSIATDTVSFPKAALGYIKSELPIFDENLSLKEWRSFARFVLNQDTGGAIRGPGRVDLFWGNGALAEKSAGAMRRFGRMYFLIAKKEILATSI